MNDSLSLKYFSSAISANGAFSKYDSRRLASSEFLRTELSFVLPSCPTSMKVNLYFPSPAAGNT